MSSVPGEAEGKAEPRALTPEGPAPWAPPAAPAAAAAPAPPRGAASPAAGGPRAAAAAAAPAAVRAADAAAPAAAAAPARAGSVAATYSSCFSSAASSLASSAGSGAAAAAVAAAAPVTVVVASAQAEAESPPAGAGSRPPSPMRVPPPLPRGLLSLGEPEGAAASSRRSSRSRGSRRGSRCASAEAERPPWRPAGVARIPSAVPRASQSSPAEPELAAPAAGEDGDGPGCLTMQRFLSLRNNISLTLDLQVGTEPSASSRDRGNAGETCGWRKLTLATVPTAEDDENMEAAGPSPPGSAPLASDGAPRRRRSLLQVRSATDAAPPRRRSLLQVRSAMTTGGRAARSPDVALDPMVRVGSTRSRKAGLPVEDGRQRPHGLEGKVAAGQGNLPSRRTFRRRGRQGNTPRVQPLQDVQRPRGAQEGDLNEFVQYLGYIVLRVEDPDVLKVADEVTPYSTLDFNEAVAFVEKYARTECQKLLALFRSYDDDESGKLSVEELRRALSSFGFVPYRAMVEEAMEVVDDNGDDELDFEEFMHFLTVYRHHQGFTQQQVSRALRTFGRFTEDIPKLGKVLLKASVGPALCQLYGPRSEGRSANVVVAKHFGSGGRRRGNQVQQHLAGRRSTPSRTCSSSQIFSSSPASCGRARAGHAGLGVQEVRQDLERRRHHFRRRVGDHVG
ncbi:unnamed protein product [Prorocentrum cordatum]|uniref:Calmodulin n=1 Tax=Prorocentrum cordatum TaxID=2364126 RepID=A0ABN9SMH4_9DINO|nr:unnamed protein product [Polarella glacialis]